MRDTKLDSFFWLKINYCILGIDVMARHQKLGIILENKTSQKLKLSKNAFFEICGPKSIFVNKKVRKIPLSFDIEN